MALAAILSALALVAGWMSAELRRVEAERRAREAERVRAAQLAEIVSLISQMQAGLPGVVHPEIAASAGRILQNEWGGRHGRVGH